MKTLEDPRDLIRKKLEFHLIGPADGIFDRPSTVEIIIGKPLHKYYSAILFPGLDVEDTEIGGITDDDDDNWTEYDEEPDDDTEADDATDVIEREEVKDQDPATSELYPRSMGLTFCLPRSTKSFTCVSEFGTYQEISPSDKKTYDHYAMKMPLDDFQKIKNMGDQVGENNVRISDLFNYDADHSRLTLKRALKGTMSGTRTGDFEILDSIRKKLLEKLQKSEAKSKTPFSDYYTIFNKLMDMTKPAWVRADHTQENIIQVSELLENEEIRLDLLNSKIAKNTNLLASLYIKLVKVEAKHI
ncbi:MAG: hypothetical protein GXY81_00940 [Candidatus Cloacimonetes bacterium]|nr:hypothetical protein [Candidatus Cloacimonadota bacterium]